MMFKNRMQFPLSFDVHDTHYDVEIDGVVEIPDKYAYVVALHGLPLDQLEAVAPSAPKGLRDAPTEPLVKAKAPSVPPPPPAPSEEWPKASDEEESGRKGKFTKK